MEEPAIAMPRDPGVHPDDTPDDALPPGTDSTGRIGTYSARDGRSLRYRVVGADAPRGRIVYLHGIESHGAWFLPAAAELRRRGFATYLLDRRGSGLNRCVAPGDAPDAAALIDDVHRFRQGLGDGPVHLAALSWGGKLALAAALEHPADWRSVTLITPGLVPRVSLPLRHRCAVLLSMIGGDGGRMIPVPIRPEMFTTTPRFLRFIRNDPWRLHRVTARFCLASRALDRRLVRRSVRLTAPMLVILAGRDRIIDNPGVAMLAGRLQPDAAFALFSGAEHAVQFDRTIGTVDRMTRFLNGAPPVRSRP